MASLAAADNSGLGGRPRGAVTEMRSCGSMRPDSALSSYTTRVRPSRWSGASVCTSTTIYVSAPALGAPASVAPSPCVVGVVDEGGAMSSCSSAGCRPSPESSPTIWLITFFSCAYSWRQCIEGCGPGSNAPRGTAPHCRAGPAGGRAEAARTSSRNASSCVRASSEIELVMRIRS